jgi:hypothetical protein
MIPYYIQRGEPEPGCPCITEDDKKINAKKAAKRELVLSAEAAAREEKSMKIRLAAVEKALWGKSFEGVLVARRPKVIVGAVAEVPDALPARKRARK